MVVLEMNISYFVENFHLSLGIEIIHDHYNIGIGNTKVIIGKIFKKQKYEGKLFVQMNLSH